MANGPFAIEPEQNHYDVVIIGGAIMGSSVAWFLSRNPDFQGSVLVIERDQSYATCSTAHTNSCMRQQFSTALNVQISQFAADFVKNLPAHMGNDPRVPALSIQSFGYLYLADTPAFGDALRRNQSMQKALGAGTRILTPDEIAAAYPFYQLDDILLGSLNLVDEGYWDGATVFDWMKRQAREAGVTYIENRVTGIDGGIREGEVRGITLASGTRVSCGRVVNTSGPRAAEVAAMAGIDLQVEPRKRHTWIFRAETPLDRDLPLTIDPSGVHVRENGGGTYMAGGHGDDDAAVSPDDFEIDFSLWETKIWPALATRIPQFEAIKVQQEWVGHYAMNTFDQNAIIGPHPLIDNFLMLNGFSGHGLQQAPALGRGVAEWLTYGTYQTLDLSELHIDRIQAAAPLVEAAVI